MPRQAILLNKTCKMIPLCYHLACKILMEVYIMARKIVGDCIKCGACAENCPVEAISEGEEKYVIDADVCIDCGLCEGNCPVEAIEEA